jgi:hypothetical protein
MKHLSEEDLVLLYYDEPGVAEGSKTALVHLAECADCRVAAESLAQTLDACNEWSPPVVGPELGRSVWARLAPQLDRRPSASGRSRFWLMAAAVAALVVAAFFAGRNSLRPAPAITAGLSEPARERILSIALADHLDRAQLLLTEVANMNDTDAVEFAASRARAKDLVNEGRLLQQVMASRSEPLYTSTRESLDEVGRFVLEVANAPDSVNAGDIQGLKQRIDAESLLFKVRIIETNLRTKNAGTSGKMS